MGNLTLFQLAADRAALIEKLLALQDDPQAIADTLEAEDYDIEQKSQNCGYALMNLEAEADAIEAAAQAMMKRAKAKRAAAERLKDYVLLCMQVAGMTKVACPHFEIALVNNPEKVEIFDERQVPAQFWRTPEPVPVVDKTAIKAAAKAGEAVPGAKLVRTQRLAVR